MNRRSFIAWLAALPIIGRVVPKPDPGEFVIPKEFTAETVLKAGVWYQNGWMTINEYRAAIGLDRPNGTRTLQG